MNQQNLSEDFQPSPENYAAIYARKSIKNENNSLEGQKILALDVLKEKGLLLYAIYEDEHSGRDMFKCKDFCRLFSDAKSGLFKTIIAFRHDRLARSLKDWITIRNEFSKLGISIIFTDKNEFQPNDTYISRFVENLIISVSQLEPNRTVGRAVQGMEVKREEGVYTSPKVPFGYTRIKDKETIEEFKKSINTNKKFNSLFTIDTIREPFVKYIFNKYINSSGNRLERIAAIQCELKKYEDIYLYLSNEDISNIISVLSNNSALENNPLDEKQKFVSTFIYEPFNSSSRDSEILEAIRQEYKIIFDHFKRDTNINQMIGNSRYCGYQLIKKKNKDLSFESDEGNDSYSINFEYYAEVINIKKPIIDKELWEKAATHHYSDYNPTVNNHEYTFKNLIKCGKCKGTILFYDQTYYCKDGCTVLKKEEIVKIIFDKLIDEALTPEKFRNYFKAEEKIIKDAKDKVESEINSLEESKRYLITTFLANHLSETAKKINENYKLIATKKDILMELNYENQNLIELKQMINSIHSDSTKRTHFKKYIIQVFMKDESKFHNILTSLISTVVILPDDSKQLSSFQYIQRKDCGRLLKDVNKRAARRRKLERNPEDKC